MAKHGHLFIGFYSLGLDVGVYLMCTIIIYTWAIIVIENLTDKWIDSS